MLSSVLCLAAAFQIGPFYQQKPDYRAVRPLVAVENGDIADWRYVNYLRMMTDESHESVKEEG